MPTIATLKIGTVDDCRMFGFIYFYKYINPIQLWAFCCSKLIYRIGTFRIRDWQETWRLPKPQRSAWNNGAYLVNMSLSIFRH